MRILLAWLIAVLAVTSLIIVNASLQAPAAPAVPAAAVQRDALSLAGSHAAAPDVSRYRVRPGDTLSAISARYCGTPADWAGLAAASGVGDPGLILPGQVIVLDCARVPARGAAHAITGPSVPSGTLGCAGLEALWEDAGGSAAAAATAASVALAESGGSQYARSPGGDVGYWQIAASHGAQATTDALGNARAAVSISGDGTDWYPWTTWTSGAYLAHPCPSAGAVLASASRAAAGPYAAARALAWAESQAGKPYVWGGTGPYGYDCSGLVYAAYRAADPSWPGGVRDTYEMLAAAGGLLVRVASPQPGDLAFFGTGHVELYVRPGVTFGAQQPGTDVGFHDYGGWYAPTAFYALA